MNWYLKVLRNYAVFNGRASRQEFWMFTLFNFIFLIIAAVIDNVLGVTFDNNFNFLGATLKFNTGFFGFRVIPNGYVYLIYSLAVIIPAVAVLVRRLHDVGKSGWMILIALIPLIGVIWLFVLTVTDSNSGENQYGSNPKGVIA